MSVCGGLLLNEGIVIRTVSPKKTADSVKKHNIPDEPGKKVFSKNL